MPSARSNSTASYLTAMLQHNARPQCMLKTNSSLVATSDDDMSLCLHGHTDSNVPGDTSSQSTGQSKQSDLKIGSRSDEGAARIQNKVRSGLEAHVRGQNSLIKVLLGQEADKELCRVRIATKLCGVCAEAITIISVCWRCKLTCTRTQWLVSWADWSVSIPVRRV